MEEVRDGNIFNLETPPYRSSILRNSPPPPPSPSQKGAGESNHHHHLGRGVVRKFTASPHCTDDILFFQKTRTESTLKIPTLTQGDFEKDKNYSFTLKRKKIPKPAYEDDEHRMTKYYPSFLGYQICALSSDATMEETRDRNTLNLEAPPYLSSILRNSPPPPTPAQKGAGESNHHHQLGRGVVRGFTASPHCTDDILFFQKTRTESTPKIPILTQGDFEKDKNYSFTLKKKIPKAA